MAERDSEGSADQQRLAERYGRSGGVQRAFPVVAAVVAVLLAGWLVWVIWDQSAPKATSSVETWDVVDEHRVEAVVIVDLADDATGATCRLRAYAEDHVTVGEATFTPVDGSQTVSIRTEREATSVEKIGCTADGQNDAR